MGTRHPHDKRVSTPNKNFFQCLDKAVIGGIVNRQTGGTINLKDSRSGNPAVGKKGTAEISNQLVDQYEPNLFAGVLISPSTGELMSRFGDSCSPFDTAPSLSDSDSRSFLGGSCPASDCKRQSAEPTTPAQLPAGLVRLHHPKAKPDMQPHIGNTVCKCLFIFGNLRGNNRVEAPVK